MDFDELESSLLHAKIQDHRTSSSMKEDFKKFLPYMGVAAILVMLPEPLYIHSFPLPKLLKIKIGF